MLKKIENYNLVLDRKDPRPYITVADYGITFPKAAIECLHYAKEVNIFYDDTNKIIAFKPCEKDKNSHTFWNESAARVKYVRWTTRRHRNHIFRLLGITPSRPGIQLEGEYFPEEDLLLFRL